MWGSRIAGFPAWALGETAYWRELGKLNLSSERPKINHPPTDFRWVLQPEPTLMRYVREEEPQLDTKWLFLMTGLVVVLGAGVLSVVTVSLLRLS